MSETLHFVTTPATYTGRDSSLGTATRYGLDGPGSNPSDFPHPGPGAQPQLLYK